MNTTTQINNKQIVRISKFMSWLLRHGLDKLSIKYNTEGFILLDDLMKQPEMNNITYDIIHYIVNENGKQRFTLKSENGVRYIRANQGHSKSVGNNIDDDTALTKITLPYAVCVHGTNRKAWETIKTAGLLPMDRKHIHLATGLANDTTIVSGMRQTSNVIIHIDMGLAMEKGKTFYMSSNGVILTADHLEPDLFSKITYT
jgi:2'-phosphotransferase